MPRAILALARLSLQRRATPSTILRRSILPPCRPFTMSTATQYPSSSVDGPSEGDAAAAATQNPQGLPAPGGGTPITLDVSGGAAAVKLSDLGPLVVNVDGTVARIANWKEMTEAERETTLRMVGRRNKQRLDALKQRREEGEGEVAAGADGAGGGVP